MTYCKKISVTLETIKSIGVSIEKTTPVNITFTKVIPVEVIYEAKHPIQIIYRQIKTIDISVLKGIKGEQGEPGTTTWEGITDKPSSSVEDIDGAVSHSQLTGNPHQTKASQIDTDTEDETVQSELDKRPISDDIIEIKVVSELPETPNPNVLYIILED